MNEQLKELAYKSGLLSKLVFDDSWVPNPKLEAKLKKFAELIVKECADKAYKTAWDDLTLGYGIGVIPLHISNTIKEHFGVEE